MNEKIDLRYVPKNSRIITLEEEIKSMQNKLSALKSYEYNSQKNRGGKNE